VPSINYQLEGEAKGGDLFYYETSCGIRESIEKKIHILMHDFKADVDDLKTVKQSLKETDANLKHIKAEIARLRKKLQKPFPTRPSYMPERYWWYIV